jgi:hypothetical protein
MRESETNSAAAIATLVLDQELRAVVRDRFSEAIKRPVQLVTDDPKFACEGAQSYRLPSYQLPASCRIELLADMVRVAADCRRNFGATTAPLCICRPPAMESLASDSRRRRMHLAPVVRQVPWPIPVKSPDLRPAQPLRSRQSKPDPRAEN